jgi:CDP-paratose 2-epimerase
MRILITGGAGFIGSRLARHLHRTLPDARITCMDNLHRCGSELHAAALQREDIHFHRGDVRREADFPNQDCDLLIECSAEPSVLAGLDGDTRYLYHTNVTGAYHCLEHARLHGSQFLFLSTSRVYPIVTLESHPWEEQQTRFAWKNEGVHGITSRGVREDCSMLGARSLYGTTKLTAELLIEEYRAAFGLRAIINRCGVIAGPGQFGKVDQGIVSHWVLAHLFSRPLAYIGYGGQGKQVRDVLHIADLCTLIELQIRDFSVWDGWCGNVAGGLENSISLCELTQLCSEATGKQVDIQHVAETRPADLRLYIADCSKLLARTSWKPKWSVKQIVADTASWAQQHHDELVALT